MDTGCHSGGSLKVLEFIQDHPAELAYDFRHKFQLSIFDIGGKVSLAEAVLLIATLLTETDSHLTAAVQEWKNPVSREWIVLTHLYDLLAAVNSKNKPKPYPTPWPDKNSSRLGKAKNISSDEVMRRLGTMNPKEENG